MYHIVISYSQSHSKYTSLSPVRRLRLRRGAGGARERRFRHQVTSYVLEDVYLISYLRMSTWHDKGTRPVHPLCGLVKDTHIL